MFLDLLRAILSDTIAIFTIMNPLSVGGIMLGLLGNTSKEEINSTAGRTVRTAFVAMLVIFLVGNHIFNFFGISPHGLRVFGGIILFLMGYNMVQGHGKRVNHNEKDQKAALEREDIAMVPLGIPVMVGAGLATTLLNLSVAAKAWQDYVSALVAIVICSLAALLILRRMPYIKHKLGVNGLKVFNRIMGLIVGSLAAQMILSGATQLIANYL